MEIYDSALHDGKVKENKHEQIIFLGIHHTRNTLFLNLEPNM
jgi:hypothetical protein